MTNVHDPQSFRHIKTARSLKDINDAARKGFRPLVRPVRRSPVIHSKFQVSQNMRTGEIDVSGDFRSGSPGPEWETVIPFEDYYPHNWPSPYAAYLVPADLQIGERVILDDLIEDFVGSEWNQGDTYRLESAEATWTGSDFRIHYEANDVAHFVG